MLPLYCLKRHHLSLIGWMVTFFDAKKEQPVGCSDKKLLFGRERNIFASFFGISPPRLYTNQNRHTFSSNQQSSSYR